MAMSTWPSGHDSLPPSTTTTATTTTPLPKKKIVERQNKANVALTIPQKNPKAKYKMQ